MDSKTPKEQLIARMETLGWRKRAIPALLKHLTPEALTGVALDEVIEDLITMHWKVRDCNFGRALRDLGLLERTIEQVRRKLDPLIGSYTFDQMSTFVLDVLLDRVPQHPGIRVGHFLHAPSKQNEWTTVTLR